MSSSECISNPAARDRFFELDWPEVKDKYIRMLTAKHENLDKENVSELIKSIGLMMVIISDMRTVELEQRAEIASLKILAKMKE